MSEKQNSSKSRRGKKDLIFEIVSSGVVHWESWSWLVVVLLVLALTHKLIFSHPAFELGFRWVHLLLDALNP